MADGVGETRVSARKGAGGPRTKRAKAALRLNPIKHGVLSQTPVIPLVERREDWDRLLGGMMEYWTPAGMMEEVLVRRLAELAWRMWRLGRFEVESVMGYLLEVPRDYWSARLKPGEDVPVEMTEGDIREMDRMLMERLLPGDSTLEKVMRYESRLHRFFLQTMHQLMILQGLRRGPGTQWGTPGLMPPGMPNEKQRPMMNRLLPGGKRPLSELKPHERRGRVKGE